MCVFCQTQSTNQCFINAKNNGDNNKLHRKNLERDVKELKGWVLIIRTFFNSHLHHEIHDFFLKKSYNSVVFVQAKTYQQV